MRQLLAGIALQKPMQKSTKTGEDSAATTAIAVAALQLSKAEKNNLSLLVEEETNNLL